MGERQRYSKAFKEEAVRLLDAGDKPAAALARDMGVRRNQLYKWKEQLARKGDAAFPGHGGRPRKEDEDEVARLRRELKRVTEERDILKKAAAYFAKVSG